MAFTRRKVFRGKTSPSVVDAVVNFNVFRIFAGFTPRVLWITLGGAIFFGFYDLTSRFMDSNKNGTSLSI